MDRYRTAGEPFSQICVSEQIDAQFPIRELSASANASATTATTATAPNVFDGSASAVLRQVDLSRARG
jgi:hypothetical protein